MSFAVMALSLVVIVESELPLDWNMYSLVLKHKDIYRGTKKGQTESAPLFWPKCTSFLGNWTVSISTLTNCDGSSDKNNKTPRAEYLSFLSVELSKPWFMMLHSGRLVKDFCSQLFRLLWGDLLNKTVYLRHWLWILPSRAFKLLRTCRLKSLSFCHEWLVSRALNGQTDNFCEANYSFLEIASSLAVILCSFLLRSSDSQSTGRMPSLNMISCYDHGWVQRLDRFPFAGLYNHQSILAHGKDSQSDGWQL